MKNPARGRRVFGELRYLCLKIYLYEYKGFAGADGFVGVPARVIKQVSAAQIEANLHNAAHYVEHGKLHAAELAKG